MRSLLPESLDSKLLKYSLTAGAVLLGAREGRAQIVYTNPTPQLNVSEFSIDFNGDGTIDLDVKAYRGKVSSTVATSDIDIYPGKVLGYNKMGIYHLGSVLNSGASIGPGGSFTGFTERLVYSFVGQWPGKTQKFLGVKFTISGQTHYGWVRLSCSSTAPYTMSVYDYAYEATANTGIKAGDKSLPVQMASFTAENANDEVQLKWSTASEVNLAGFVVERSAVSNQLSAANWVKIGYVKSAGTNTSTTDYSFTDTNPVSGKVEYRLKEMNTDGTYKYTTPVTVNAVPTKFELSQNYPNPFNPTTKIDYALPKVENVTLRVYNSLGEVVSTLVDEEKQPGEYTATFDGTNLASGVYFYEISAGDFKQVKKLMLLK